MSPTVPTGPIGSVGGAVARRAKNHWDRGHEGHKLISRIGKRARGDAAIPYEIRDELADQLSERIQVDPIVQEAIGALLDGNEILSAQEALSVRISELCANLVTWPAGFDATAFGVAVAAHAIAAINVVKATDREAAHHDHLVTRQAFAAELQQALGQRDPPSHGIGALLRGALRQIDHESRAQAAANRQAKGRLSEAAGIASDVASALEEAGLAPAAVSFRIWAAQLRAAGGEREEATQILGDLVWQHLDSPLQIAAHSAIGQLRQIGVPDWQARAFEAAESWPRLPWAANWLDHAIEAEQDPDTRWRWIAVRVRIARLLELEPQTVLQLTLDADQCPIVSLRLALQLDRLDALELERAAGATDPLWGQIADWIETYGTPSDQAKAWRRRGCALATRNDLAAAQDAYRRALRILEQARIGATEAADTVFSLWHTEALLGGGHFPDMGARGIAMQMRNAGPLSWAESAPRRRRIPSLK